MIFLKQRSTVTNVMLNTPNLKVPSLEPTQLVDVNLLPFYPITHNGDMHDQLNEAAPFFISTPTKHQAALLGCSPEQ